MKTIVRKSIKPGESGFTLIELLIVIAIIGLLASIVLISLSNARVKSRDAKRIADLKQINTSLELYYNDNNHYPNTGGAWTSFDSPGYSPNPIFSPNAANLTAALVPAYIGGAPKDPKNLGGDSGYLYISNGKGYTLMAYRTPENMNFFPQSMWMMDWCLSVTASTGQCTGNNAAGIQTSPDRGY